MGITDQCKPGAILIGGAIRLCLLDLIDRQDNLRGLTRESRCLQGHGRSLNRISKIVEQLLFDRRIIVPHDFIILGFVIRDSKVKLVLDQLLGLLGKELRRDIPRHRIPVALLLQLVDRREVLFAVITDIHTLAVSLDSCAKRVVRIRFCFLEDLHFGRARRLIGVEHNVHTIRQIIRIDCHALQIMVTVNEDTNLRIMALAEVKVGHTTANLHNTVFVQTAFIAITNCNSTGIQTRGALKLREGLAAIIGVVIAQRIDLILMLISILLVELRLCENRDVRLLTDIGRLSDTNAIALVAIFCFQNISSLVQLTFRHSEDLICALRNINHALLIDLFFQSRGNLLSLAGFFANRIVILGPHTGLAHAELVANFLPTKTVILQRTNLIVLQCLTVMACFLTCSAELGQAHLILVRERVVDGLQDLLLREALLFKLLYTRQEIAGMLIRVIAGAPRIATRMSLGTIVLQDIAFGSDAKIRTEVFFNRIHAATPNKISVMIGSNSLILAMTGLISSSVGFSTQTSSFW